MSSKRQSVGVWGTKHLIKWLYPEAVAAFDPCAAQHDKDYKTVDWSKGDDATLDIDGAFRLCCWVAAGTDEKLQHDAELFYRTARRWGVMRAWLWEWGFRW
jgi:hypothetical protein